MAIDRNVLLARIETLASAEKITKKELGLLSREMLVYIVLDDTNDIDMVNRLLSVLSPVNKRVAILYFSHFLPFKAEYEGEGKAKRFIGFGGKLKGEKKLARHVEAVKEFLSYEFNNIWTWQAEHVEVEKAPDYAATIERAVKKALSDEDNGLDQVDILKAVMAGGVDINAIMLIISNMAEQPQAEAA